MTRCVWVWVPVVLAGGSARGDPCEPRDSLEAQCAIAANGRHTGVRVHKSRFQVACYFYRITCHALAVLNPVLLCQAAICKRSGRGFQPHPALRFNLQGAVEGVISAALSAAAHGLHRESRLIEEHMHKR